MTKQRPGYLAPHLMIYNVSEDMQLALIKWAAILGMSKTAIAKQAIQDYLDKKEREYEDDHRNL